MKNCIMWLRDLDTKKTGTELFGQLQNLVLQRMETIKLLMKLTNEVLELIVEKKTLLNNILSRKAFFVIPLKDR